VVQVEIKEAFTLHADNEYEELGCPPAMPTDCGKV
jgi:hypothetical protein